MKTILIIFFVILPDKHRLVPMVSAQGVASRPALEVGLRDALLLSQAPQPTHDRTKGRRRGGLGQCRANAQSFFAEVHFWKVHLRHRRSSIQIGVMTVLKLDRQGHKNEARHD